MKIGTIGYRIESVAGNRLLFPQNLSSNENTFSQLLDFILYHQTNGNRNDYRIGLIAGNSIVLII